MVEEPVKTIKKKDLIRIDEETAKRLQAEFDEEERLAREKNEANVTLIEEWDDIQAKINANHELAQRLQVEEQEELSVKEKAKLFQQLLEQRRKHFATKNEDKDTAELQSLMEVIPDEEEVAINVGRNVMIKSLLNAVSITAAPIDVNAAQSKLVLLENFKENYSKCLRLLYKVNAAEGVNAASKEVSTAELVSTAYSQAKDIVIRKLKERIKSLSEKDSVENVKKDIDEIETINIELKHSVAKLLSENDNLRKEREHLKSIFKDQFDSIGKTRVQLKEHCDSLIAQINAKSVENS
ncbi:hypothetical protein Tco_0999147, partial [Tanacetum coccineum]